MSKYSAKDKISKKLEDSIAQTNAPLTEKDDLTPDEIAKLTPEEFDFAEYDETAAERAGYSNYSYWRSTIRVFFKNKVAVTNLVIMLVLVLFTFLQPLLPNQFDPNLVNKFDEKAVWLIVDEDGKAKLSGIKYTKGDYAAETDGRNTTLAYVQAPEDWGNIKLYVQEKGGVAEEIAATADSENPGWYYAVISAEKPYMYVTSEDGEKTTYFQACWITVDAETTGVTSSSSKQTSGELIADVPEGCVLTYLYVPEKWGTPKVMASGIMRGSEASEVEFTPLEGEGNEGWYYAFVNSEQMMLEITSENGEYKGMNKGVARVTDPTEITPQVGFISNQRPNEVYWFGTNDIGQDLWSRMWSGTRTSLFIGIVVAAIEAVVGILVGLLWGYVRKLDFFFTELYNVLDNIPQTLLLILISWNVFYHTDLGRLRESFAIFFGFADSGFTSETTNMLLRNNLPLIAICAVGCSAIPQFTGNVVGLLCAEKREDGIGHKVYAGLTFVFDLALLALATISLAGSSYNAFLYFRF